MATGYEQEKKMSVLLKLKVLTPKEIASAVGGSLELFFQCNEEISQKYISTSSLECGEGKIFCAIKGQRVDGHDYIADAVTAGSSCVICERVPDNARDLGKPFCAVIVEDTIKAIGRLASYYRDLTDAKFIAITGSVGKTTTKEFIYSVASAAFKTHKTQGNYNNELGLPLTIFGISPEDKIVVLEMGMSDLGEIEYMTKIRKSFTETALVSFSSAKPFLIVTAMTTRSLRSSVKRSGSFSLRFMPGQSLRYSVNPALFIKSPAGMRTEILSL